MKKIAVLTSGSDAPGMNACIRAVLRSANLYQIDTLGVFRGFEGLIKGDFCVVDDELVSNIIQKGGTALKCGYSKDFKTKEGRKKAYENLIENQVDGLIVIGGKGSFTGLEIFNSEFSIPCIGIPATIDNALYGTDFTIGHDTAVNNTLEAIDHLRDTADSHERIFFVEVMGMDAGFIAVHSAISGGAEMALIPEKKTTIKDIISRLTSGNNLIKASQIIIIGEDNKTGNIQKIAAEVKKSLPALDTKVTILGDLQRGGIPTSADRVLASQLGIAAVEGLLNGKTNTMTGMVKGKLLFTPLNHVVNKKKKVGNDLIRMIEILNGCQ